MKYKTNMYLFQYFIDHVKYQIRIYLFICLSISVSALVFTGIATIGTFLFAVASFPQFRGTEYMFPLMLVGRLLLGAGTGSSRSKLSSDYRVRPEQRFRSVCAVGQSDQNLQWAHFG